MVFVFLCLTHFTQHNALKVYACCCKWQDFILFYGRVIFHCVPIPQFFHSFIDGHLVFFHTLAVINNTAVNIGVHIFLSQCFHFLQIKTQKWNCQIVLQFYFYFFEETSYCFPQCCINLHSYQQCTRVPFSLISLQHSLIPFFFFLNNFRSDRYEVISHYVVLICISLISDIEHLFMYPWLFLYLLWKTVYLDLFLML